MKITKTKLAKVQKSAKKNAANGRTVATVADLAAWAGLSLEDTAAHAEELATLGFFRRTSTNCRLNPFTDVIRTGFEIREDK